MTDALRFAILGPVDAHVDGRPVTLGARKPRALLATLLTAHRQVVSVARIVDAVWGDDPPRSARGLIQTYVAGLRRGFEAAGARGVVQHRDGGYAVTGGTVDAACFTAEVTRARACRETGDRRTAVATYRAALDRWRGPALGGLGGPVLSAAAAALDESRLTALEERIATELELGEHPSLVGELTALVETHPLREGLHAHLIHALHGAGRTAEALAAYRAARDRLVEELGVEPGPLLRAAHQAVLRGTAPPNRTVRARPPTPRPAQVPPPVADFVGRASALATVVAALTPTPGRMAPPVVLITGPAGAGKSTLAHHAAHAVRHHYPDGQLYVAVAGMSDHPVPLRQVLLHLLHSLGVDTSATDVSALGGLLLSVCADRRLLIVLDDVLSAAQVGAVLPGTPQCAVLVSSRQHLGGLAALRVDLDVLAADESRQLLAAVAGTDRVAAEPAAAEAIVRACGGLPLAVRLAGARLAGRPHWPLRRLADRLGDRVLEELHEEGAGVRASLRLSYRGLDPAAALALRLLGVLGVPECRDGFWRPCSGWTTTPPRTPSSSLSRRGCWTPTGRGTGSTRWCRPSPPSRPPANPRRGTGRRSAASAPPGSGSLNGSPRHTRRRPCTATGDSGRPRRPTRPRWPSRRPVTPPAGGTPNAHCTWRSSPAPPPPDTTGSLLTWHRR
ncbi:MAG TPA: BTAD domain-containing putative transcriptional regulator [Pilimelia sp.]|nr:BTAD domain-containing putative transcriptional regulator [Pilimelia sp.]